MEILFITVRILTTSIFTVCRYGFDCNHFALVVTTFVEVFVVGKKLQNLYPTSPIDEDVFCGGRLTGGGIVVDSIGGERVCVVIGGAMVGRVYRIC